MKRCLNIIGFVLVLLFFPHCGREKTQQIKGQGSETHAALAEIDSLMWRQPDSAFVLLQEFVVSPEVEEFDTFDGHYCQVLISELLYKKDYSQTNRTELLQAVAYFDSLMQVPKPAVAEHGRSIEGPSNRIAFLSARAHYINGVGYYENDSMVEACKEYLKALEVMEDRYEEKELVGHKARFMAYAYGRLGEVFEGQLFADPAITCFKQALYYCRIEPTSKYGIAVLLYSIGVQFDIAKQKDSAAFYYDKALTYLPDNDNIHYRDIITSKTILAFNKGLCLDSVIKDLEYVVSFATDEDEKTTRFLTLGNILFESRHYDSSRFYLETVFEHQEDISSKIVAAEYLCSIYQMKGDSVKASQYSSFLANYTVKEIEKKADVSRINEMFKNYMAQKQEKQAEEKREKAVKRVMGIIIPIAVAIALTVFIVVKQRGKELVKKQQTETEILLEEKNKQLAKEKKARQREKEKLRQGLRQREAQVSALEKALCQLREEAEIRREAFMKEAICCKINDSIRSQRITARNSHEKYVSFTEEDASTLKAAVLRHYENFDSVLLGKYPKLSNDDLQLCQLYLMGLDERQIAVLQNKSYSAIKKRANTLKDLLGLDENLKDYLLRFSSSRETS